MDIKKHITEELNTVKHSELNTWGNKPKPPEVNLKVSQQEAVKILGEEYDAMLKMIDKMYSVFSKKAAHRIGVLPEDADVIEDSFQNNHTYIKNDVGYYRPASYHNGLDDHIFDQMKTFDIIKNGVKFGSLSERGYGYGDDYRSALVDIMNRMVDGPNGHDEQLYEDLDEMIHDIEESQLLELYYTMTPEEVIEKMMSEIKSLEDDDLVWMKRGHNDGMKYDPEANQSTKHKFNDDE
jgi:hypothetical protein